MNSKTQTDPVSRFLLVLAGGLFAVLLAMGEFGFGTAAVSTGVLLLVLMALTNLDEIYCRLFGHSWEIGKIPRQELPDRDVIHYQELMETAEVCSVCGETKQNETKTTSQAE